MVDTNKVHVLEELFLIGNDLDLKIRLINLCTTTFFLLYYFFPFSAASAQYSRALYQTFAPETNQSSYSGYSEVICDDTCPSFTFVRESSRGICEQVSQYGALIVLFCFYSRHLLV